MQNGLERFHVAQDAPARGFASALKELQTSGKREHWIWYIFPQLAGLGMSAASRLYGLRGREEAVEYLRDPVLRSRLIGITRVVAQRLQDGVPLIELMGSRIDVLKLVSSLTLFENVSRGLEAEAPDAAPFAELAGQVLAAAKAQGYERCFQTLRLLEAR